MTLAKKFSEPFPFELTIPAGQVPFPLIFITPLLGRLILFEDLYFERRLAAFFAKNGFAAAVIQRPFFEFNPSQGLEQIQEYLVAMVSRNRSVLDCLVKMPAIDTQNIGSFGMSFGAVVNCLWAGSDKRLKANILALAGGNIPEILITSREFLLRSYVKTVKENLKLTDDSLLLSLKENFPLDTLRAAASIPRENVLMVIAVFDRVVRLRYGLALRRALNKPRTLFLPLGHYPSILAMPFLKWTALDFFKTKIKKTRTSR